MAGEKQREGNFLTGIGSEHRLQIARMVGPRSYPQHFRHNIVNFVRAQLISPDVVEAEV